MTLPDESRDVNCKSQEIWNWLVHLRSNRVKGSEIEVLKNAKRKKKTNQKCDHFKLGVRTRVRAHLNLDVRGACVRPKKRSQLTPCYFTYPLIFDSLSGSLCKLDSHNDQLQVHKSPTMRNRNVL